MARTALTPVIQSSIHNTVEGIHGWLGSETRVIVLAFGLDDGRRRDDHEVAAELGIPVEEARRSRSIATSMLRHPSTSHALRELEPHDLSRAALERMRPAGSVGVMELCVRHGRIEPWNLPSIEAWPDPRFTPRFCQMCFCRTYRTDRPGRPRKYCDSDCATLAARFKRSHRSSVVMPSMIHLALHLQAQHIPIHLSALSLAVPASELQEAIARSGLQL